MFLKNIKLENFKSFKTADIDFSKITLLTGANSSGKSSLMYSFLGTMQSGMFPFFYSPNGDYVNMGDFKSVSHLHKIRNKIKVGAILANDDSTYSYEGYYSEDNKNKMPKLFSLKMDCDYLKLAIDIRNKRYLCSINYDQNEDSTSPYKRFSADKVDAWLSMFEELTRSSLNITKTKKGDLKKILSGAFQTSTLEKIIPFRSINRFFDLLSNYDNVIYNIVIHKVLAKYFRLKDEFNYISSFRQIPDRTYYYKTNFDLKVGKYGENYIEQILEWENTKSPQYNLLLDTLRNLGVANKIYSKKISGGRYEVRVKLYYGGIDSILSDVGFGVSQLLPIIVSDLQLPDISTLFISQPEIHLHPKVQANLAEYFSKYSMLKNKKYVIETHSEYLLNRFRYLIAKGELNEEDIKIYYFSNKNDTTDTYELHFRKNGSIEGAPKDFFDTYMMDVMNIAMVAE